MKIMQKKMTPKWALPQGWLRFIIISLLALGIFFRFVNIGEKVYSNDEVITFLRISGHTKSELLQQVFTGNLIGIQDLQKYQRPTPEKGVIDTIKSFALEDQQHPPLYYVMARFWVQLFGNQVAARSCAAFISLLTFPCIYWLCLELFESSLTGWLAVALITVSPFHVLYAQEARGYSFWTVTTLLSSAALLRALRIKTRFSWGVYAVSLALGFYSHLYFALVAIGHGIYVVTIERFRLSKTFTSYLLASLASLLAFSPWMWVIITNLKTIQQTTIWTRSFKTSFVHRLEIFQINIIKVFLDLNSNFDHKNIIFYLILILVGYSIYSLVLHAPKRVWLLVLILMGVTAFAQVVPDIIWGGRRSLLPRYLTPFYLGIQLAVAYLLTTRIATISVRIRQQRLWQLILMMLLSAGVLSCAVSSQAEGWWTKSLSTKNLQIAPIINQAIRPLLLSAGDEDLVISLTYLLDPKVKLQLLNPIQQKISDIPDGFSDVFLYYPSHILREQLKQLEEKQNYKVEVVFQEPQKRRIWLCKLLKQ